MTTIQIYAEQRTMASFCDLPRDVLNQVICKLDIESRMRLGIISKIKRTDKFNQFCKVLSSKLAQTVETYSTPVVGGGTIITYGISLGPMREFDEDCVSSMYTIEHLLYPTEMMHDPEYHLIHTAEDDVPALYVL
jgi:hypothetical protein